MQMEKWTHDERWPEERFPVANRYRPFDLVMNHGAEQIRI
jgi:hypothetical protein